MQQLLLILLFKCEFEELLFQFQYFLIQGNRSWFCMPEIAPRRRCKYGCVN